MGQVVCVREKGTGRLSVRQVGPVRLLTAEVWIPEGLSPRRLARRVARAERALLRQGVGRVVLSAGFPYGGLLQALRPVETLSLYRGLADLLALGSLRRQGVPLERGRVALAGPRLCPELRETARRLCPQVRELLIDVPEEGESYAQHLRAQYGLPMTPGSAPADVAVAFGPGGRARPHTLALYGETPELDGLELSVPGLELPEDCGKQLLALLWESGELKREAVAVRAATAGPPRRHC